MLGHRIAEVGVLRSLLDDGQFGLEIEGGHMFDEKQREHGVEQHCEDEQIDRGVERNTSRLVRKLVR